MPRLSVVLPVYNHERYIPEALRSIFAQDFTDFEILAVDDGSTDASLQILDRYRYRVQVLPMSHTGPASARNRAIRASDSEFVAFMDADDVCAPERLRIQFDKLQREKLDFVTSALSFIDANGCALPGIWACPEHARNDYWGALLERNWIGTPTVMLRRRVLDSVGAFDESFTHAEDYDLWLRAGRAHSIGYVEAPLIRCRRHAGNTSNDTASHERFERLALQKVEAKEARQAFNRLYSTPERRYEAWIWFLLRSGSPAFAEEAALGLAQHPHSNSMRFAMGVFHYDFGEYDAALRTFWSLSGADAASCHNAGVLAALCGDAETAAALFESVLGSQPGYYDAHFNLAALREGRALRLTRRPFRDALVPMKAASR
jgi:glycosyltransferase involved in cell wall biosynthesis